MGGGSRPAAAGKAQAFIRHAVRGSNGQMPPAPLTSPQAVVLAADFARRAWRTDLRSYEGIMSDEKAISLWNFRP